MSEIKDFTDLNAWKQSQEVVLGIYKATKLFPKDEQFGLTSQIRRAAISITSNIAEGFGRRSRPDKSHFYIMAQASLYEVHSQLITAQQLGYVDNNSVLINNISDAKRLLSGLIKSTQEKK